MCVLNPTIALDVSYIIPIACRRIYRNHPDVHFTPGPFYLGDGLLGWAVNINCILSVAFDFSNLQRYPNLVDQMGVLRYGHPLLAYDSTYHTSKYLRQLVSFSTTDILPSKISITRPLSRPLSLSYLCTPLPRSEYFSHAKLIMIQRVVHSRRTYTLQRPNGQHRSQCCAQNG